MCGIAGWVGSHRAPETLHRMTDAVAHRGPDGEGQAFYDLTKGTVVALGHRRLSIIDLSSGGSQPMLSHDGRFSFVYNGEVYNYIELRDELRARGAVFKSQSDSEVILEAWRYWGEDSLRRLRGMFAFALYDRDNQSVTLARDHFGKKPLLIAQRSTDHGEELVFGSEVQALLAHPSVNAELDPDSLHDYLCWRYVPGPATFFRGIRKLVPGGYLVWRDGRVVEKRFWLPPEENPDRSPAPKNPIEDFLSVFDEAVKIRLRADVPVGAFLSSGLDSASVVATLAHLGTPNIRTYSVGFRGDPASELPAATETARFFGTTHTPIELNYGDLAAHLPRLSRHRGAPIAEAADLPIYLMSKEAGKSVKVVLSGEGSDEMFAGYPKHLIESHLGHLARFGLLPVMGRGLSAVATLSPRSGRMAIAARAMREQRFDQRMVSWFGALTPSERQKIWRGPVSTREAGGIPFQAAKGASPLRQVLHYDQTSWLPDNLLERLDTMSMAASIEARSPFMDVRLAEFASSLPESWRIKGRVTKRIVREALASRLPPKVLTRKKIGFRMPVAEWFRSDLRQPAEDLLLGRDAISANYLDRGMLTDIVNQHTRGEENHEKTMWSLFTLEIFLREFFT